MSEIKIVEQNIKKAAKPKAFDWHDHAVSQSDLINKPLQPIDYLIEDMIVDCGTCVIAGPKKKGKSWLALQLSQAVAGGVDFLGHRVKQGPVVHFPLEDGERRTQARLDKQQSTEGLPITYFYSWPYFNTPAGQAQLKAMIQELKPVLVVVDTLAKCLNGKPDQNSAGDMGEFGNRIHDLALELNVMILFVAHHGKMSTRDPGFDIRGSSAIPGSTDVNIGLYKNEDGTFELIGEGRDIEEFDIRVKLDKEVTWCWHTQGDAKDARRVEAETRILEAIAILGGEADATAIAGEVGVSREAVQNQLKRMRSGDNPSVSYQVVKEGRHQRILYKSLTSITSYTSIYNLHPLQSNDGVNGCKGQGFEEIEASQTQGVNDVRDISNKVISMLGMSLEDALARWRKHGSPAIPLTHGETCSNLEVLLNSRNLKDWQIEAIKIWLEKHP